MIKMSDYKKLQRLYDRLPRINCQKKCHESCGPIVMSDIEIERIAEKLGYNPFGDNLVESLKKKLLSKLNRLMNASNVRYWAMIRHAAYTTYVL